MQTQAQGGFRKVLVAIWLLCAFGGAHAASSPHDEAPQRDTHSTPIWKVGASDASRQGEILLAVASAHTICLRRCANTKAACDAEPNPNHRQCRAEWQLCVKECPK